MKGDECVEDCGVGWYGHDGECHECATGNTYNWDGVLGVPDSWCDHNCFVPWLATYVAPACDDATHDDH